MSKENKVSAFDKFIMLCLVGIVPFVVYLAVYEPPVSAVAEAGSLYTDFFCLWKVRLILFVALIITLNFIMEVLTSYDKFFNKEKLQELKAPKYILVLLMFISTIVAFVLSDYKNIAIWGAYERFEGVFTHISYLIIFLYSISFFKKEGAFRVFSYCTLLSTFVVGGIGTLQAFGINIFANESIMNMLSGQDVVVQFTLTESYSTMYNPNVSGCYSALMLFLLGAIFFGNDDNLIKGLAVFNSVLVFIMFIFSNSEASYIAFAGGLFIIAILYVIYFLKNNQKKLATIIGGSLVVVLVGGIVVASTSSFVGERIKSFIGPVATFTDWEQINNDFMFYNKDDDYIKVSILEDGYELYEGENKLYEHSNEAVEESIETDNFGTISIQASEKNDGETYINFNDYFLIKSSDSPYLADKNSLEPINRADFIGFEGYGNLFTNRGYIWSRSIPLVFSNPLGIGSDVFMQYFPQDDIAGVAFYSQPEGLIVDKPHNLYLDMAINNGILYAVGFIGIVILTIGDKLKLLFNLQISKNINGLIFYLGGIFAYLINILATDNIVAVILLFWIYLAISSEVFKKKSTEDILKGKN